MLKSLIGGFLPPYKDMAGNIIADAVSSLEKLTIGGVEQWITMRGRSKHLPILLFFHGGPGCSQTGAQRKYNAELEDHFIVVNWDQRGAGKSFTSSVQGDSMNINQLLRDAHELVKYITEKFQQERIYLMGHSVGAALGLLFAHRYPEFVKAYIGINQPVHRVNEEVKSYHFTLNEAKKRSLYKAIKDLQAIGEPQHGTYKNTKQLVTQRTWLTKLGGVTYQMNANKINFHYLLSSHLTLKEKLNFMKGFGFTNQHLWDEVTALNFFELVREVDVPVYFIAGEYDRIVFLDEMEAYFKMLKAPNKQLIIFEGSGHYACFEESQKFNDFMIHQVLKESQEPRIKII